MINLKWCAALRTARDSSSLPNPLSKRGRQGRVQGEATNMMYGKAQRMAAKLKSVAKISAGVYRPNSTENSPWHRRESAVRITCLAFSSSWLLIPSSFGALSIAQGGNLSKSICWSSCVNCSPTHSDPAHFIVWKEHTGRKFRHTFLQ